MPWVKIADATADSTRYIHGTKEYIKEEGIVSSVVVEPETLIVSNSATPGLPKIMKIRACVHDGWLVFSGFRGVERDFLYYKFVDIRTRLTNQANGSVFQNLKTDIVKDFEVKLPPIEVQERIVEILSSLDDKIEMNNAICRNLEEQADAFYMQLFVSGKKSSWNKGKLSDLIDVKYGKDHKKMADGTIPVYGSGGLMRYAERALYESESVLIPRKGTLNNVMLVMGPFWTVDTMFYSVMKVKNAAKFVFHFLKGKDLASMNAGSAVPSMTTEILNSMELRLPPKAVLSDFEHNVAPIYQTIATKKCENDCLAALRDTLLPRLMSGELDVSAVKL